MPIHPLPQFEQDVESDRQADLADRLRAVGVSDEQAARLAELPEDDLRVYKKLAAPKTLVVRYGVMKMVGEFPYRGSAKPGCGSKMVITTHRGTEIGEMLTSTCPNSGCSKSVSRKEMLEYIDNSGGRQYPFRTDGKVLRVATPEDLDADAKLEQTRHALRTEARRRVQDAGIPAKVVDIETILGDERLMIYYTSEEQVDPRRLQDVMRGLHRARIDVRHVGARDEARITADYEKCGQYCCCKNFLKVLKPVSMRSAKIQKATLDPLKISGRCGRLMCCLRYEDETYDQLRKNLPNRKKRVGTPEGDGIVIDTQILTQLALVRLDNGTDVAIPVEELADPEHAKAPERPEPAASKFRRERPRPSRDERPASDTQAATATEDKPRRKRKRRKKPEADAAPESTSAATSESPRPGADGSATNTPESESTTGEPVKKKRRRRKRRTRDASTGSTSGSASGTPTDATAGTPGDASASPSEPPSPGAGSSDQPDANAPKKKRRRRRRRKPGGANAPDSGNPPPDAP
ncbi:MAG: regulatory iron-sulfur-containing complex subunit RicT [Planctomycetota bacterium]